MSTYDSLDDYNADVIAAREAYAADRLVEAGYCEKGCGRRRDKKGRRCKSCWNPRPRKGGA